MPEEKDMLCGDAELQKFLGISRTTIWRMRRYHGLPFRKIGGSYRYSKGDVLEWMKNFDEREDQMRLPL